MTTFDDREKAFENRYVHDQELVFRAEARRNRKVARWAASVLGEEDEAEQDVYAATVLDASLQGGTEAVVRKLVGDLAAAPTPVSEHQVRHRMEIELAKALERLKVE